VLRQIRPWCAAIALALAAAGAAFAKEGAEEEAAADPGYAAAKTAIAERRYPEALRLLYERAAADPLNADTHNLLGYAHRKSGNLERAFHHYHEALRLDPKHRGAHEYIGEAYLMASNLAKAEDHLRVLERLCQSPCEERDDLRKAIEAYKRARPTGPAGGASR
jgi:Flp pilus assembly protein TadD